MKLWSHASAEDTTTNWEGEGVVGRVCKGNEESSVSYYRAYVRLNSLL